MSVNKIPDKYKSFQDAGAALKQAVTNVTALPAIPEDAIAKRMVNKKEEREHDRARCEPVYVRKLHDVLGTLGAVGNLIGCSDASVGVGLRNNEISQCYELAAMGVWLRDYEPKPEPQIIHEGEEVLLSDGDVFVSMRIDKGAWNAIKGWLKEAGATTKVF